MQGQGSSERGRRPNLERFPRRLGPSYCRRRHLITKLLGFQPVANGYPSGYWSYCGGLYDCSRDGKKVLLQKGEFLNEGVVTSKTSLGSPIPSAGGRKTPGGQGGLWTHPGILRMPTLTHNSDAILASKGIFNLFISIGVIMPDSISPETVLMPSKR